MLDNIFRHIMYAFPQIFYIWILSNKHMAYFEIFYLILESVIDQFDFFMPFSVAVGIILSTILEIVL